MHVIVTDQHCQRQASSCIDIASLNSCTPIVKVRTCCTSSTTPDNSLNKPRECQHPLWYQLTDCTQKGSPHRLCSLTANTEVCTPPLLPIAVCVAMRNVCCEELHWLFSPMSGTVSRIVLRFVAITRTVLSDLGYDPRNPSTQPTQPITTSSSWRPSTPTFLARLQELQSAWPCGSCVWGRAKSSQFF